MFGLLVPTLSVAGESALPTLAVLQSEPCIEVAVAFRDSFDATKRMGHDMRVLQNGHHDPVHVMTCHKTRSVQTCATEVPQWP